MPASIKDLLHLGGRRAVYEALLAAISGREERPDEWRLDDSLIVAGLHRRSTELLPVFWPKDTGILFRQPEEYVARLVGLAQDSPFERVRALAISAVPNLDRATFNRCGAAEIPLALASQVVLAAKLGEIELFSQALQLLSKQSDLEGRWYRVSGPPLCADYCVGRGGPFVLYADGGSGRSYQPLGARQLFELLRVPFAASAESHSRVFESIVGAAEPISGLDEYVWRRAHG